MRKNITLAIDDKILKKARSIAIHRHTTVTQVLREYLETYIKQNDMYDAAMRRTLKRIERKPLSVGKKTWRREELHER